MRKIKIPSQSQLNKKQYFSQLEWSKVPPELKRRWWLESDHGRLEPSTELMATVRMVIDTGKADGST